MQKKQLYVIGKKIQISKALLQYQKVCLRKPLVCMLEGNFPSLHQARRFKFLKCWHVASSFYFKQILQLLNSCVSFQEASTVDRKTEHFEAMFKCHFSLSFTALSVHISSQSSFPQSILSWKSEFTPLFKQPQVIRTALSVETVLSLLPHIFHIA